MTRPKLAKSNIVCGDVIVWQWYGGHLEFISRTGSVEKEGERERESLICGSCTNERTTS